MSRAAIVGSAAWGTALGIILARNGIWTKIWARNEEAADKLNQARENVVYLPGPRFPTRLTATASLEEAMDKADMVILAVPSSTMRLNIGRVKDYLSDTTLVVSATKGLEVETGKRMSQIIAEELDPRLHPNICVLSGPNIAHEAAQGLLSVTVVAARDAAVAERAKQLVNSNQFYVFTSTDIVGVELGGAMKNVITLGVGMVDGLGNGSNAKAALIIRGLSEAIVLGTTFGANPLTFIGLSGLGDLVVTSFSPLSRNYYVGKELAKGRSVEDITHSMPHVAEGVSTAQAAWQLGQRAGLSLPIVDKIYKVLYEGLDVRKAASELVEYPADGESLEVTKLLRFLLDYLRVRWYQPGSFPPEQLDSEDRAG
ncbi:MAG: NAD(P)-dependent glycerol-3-phosphate dehydrogenase [Dehalococcoidia bacterium]|nr:NAD(P)-dependent glycerol-3-phosphate dehydrogenase [Dehalococcoidia bacterium]